MPTANAALAFLAVCTLKALVLLALAFAAAPLLRSRSAALRHAVWASVLGAILALPLLSALAPRITVALPTPAVSTESRPTTPDQIVAPRLGVDRRSVVHPTTFETHPAQSDGRASSRPLPWRQALLAVWMAGVAVVLGRLAIHLIRLKRVAARASAVTDERWLRLVDEVRRAAGVRRRVRLVRGGVGVPVTWGALRPVVMLPEGCGAWTAERRRAVLAHELAHVRRLDALTLWAARLATAAYWFAPPAWAAARRMLDESERACDDAVLRLGTLPSAYAHHLLEIARGAGAGPRAAAALAMAGSRVERRLVAILDPAQPRVGAGRAAWAGALAAALAVAVPVAGVSTASAAGVRPSAERTTGVAREAAAPVSLLRPLPGRSTQIAAPRSAAPVAAAGAPKGAPTMTDAADGQGRSIPTDTIPRAAPPEPSVAHGTTTDFDTNVRDGRDGNTHLRGEGLVLTADGRALRALQPTGWLQAEHTGPGGMRTVVVLPGVGGRPDYVYRVNGVPASMDAEAHAWFDALIANHP